MRRLFFTGKGGVGKTSLATVTAVAGADAGYRTLLVTTDPAAHIGWVLETAVGPVPQTVEAVPNLSVVRIDPAFETAQYQRQVIQAAQSDYGPETLARLKEELASPCTEEVAVFHRFLDLLLTDEWPLVVFDTAPTGHTLRLLELPLSYSQQLSVKVAGPSSVESPSPEAIRIANGLALLRNPGLTKMAFVVYPEATPILEARRAVGELHTAGIVTTHVVVNQVLPTVVLDDPLFNARYHMQQRHLAEIKDHFPDQRVLTVPMLAQDIMGMDLVRELARTVFYQGFNEVWGFSHSSSSIFQGS